VNPSEKLTLQLHGWVFKLIRLAASERTHVVVLPFWSRALRKAAVAASIEHY
jgi:hypothetical protein